MAEKASRLSDILKQEYKSKGIVGGLASATGKRVLEKLDIRNALFGGSGVGSLVGRKIFGKGYSAINEKSGADKLSSQTAPILSAQSDKLDTIGMNTQITAKNSMAIPSMARDMNVMRQNIIKMVKLQGGTATNKADAFFSKAKDREAAYEVQFGAKKETTPTKVAEKKEDKGIIGTILSALSLGVSKIFDGLKSTVGSVTGLFASLITKLPGVLSLVEGMATVLRVGIAALTSPLGLLVAGIAAAVAAVKLFTDKILDRAEKEGGEKGRELASTSIAESTYGAMDGNFVTGTNSYGEQLAGPDAMAAARKSHQEALSKQQMSGYQTRNTDTGATKVTADDDAKMNAEKYLGASMTSTDWDLLKRTVYAESSRNEQEYANVMAVILNRARNSGKSIPEVLYEKNQFQAVTGARGEGPSSNFKQGPDARSAQLIMSSTNSLQNISTSLDSFTAANAAAYGAVGGEAKFNKKMAEMQAANGKTVGATVFAENLYRPSGKRIGDTSTMMASMTRESLIPQSPNINITAPQTQQGQQQAPITVATADVLDTDFGRLLQRMY